ncbi:MAG: histidine kinase [Proteobacteria bacterium]|nr:histidine kinase [Pseudomonadota bacterium]
MMRNVFGVFSTLSALPLNDPAPAAGNVRTKAHPGISITKRLGALFALMSLLLLAAIGSTLYLALVHKLENRDQDELIGRVQLIRSYLRDLQTVDELREMDQHWGNALTGGRRTVHLVLADEEGKPLFRSTSLGPDGPISLKPVSQEDAAPASSRLWKTNSEEPVRLVTAWGRLGKGEDAQHILIGLSLSTNETRQTLRESAYILLLTVVLGTLVAAVLGIWVARRGLAPVAAITQTAREITASNLSQRLPEGEVPEEFYLLAKAFNGMLARLDDAFQKQSDLSSDLAHELRTPINSLMLQAQVALSQARTIEEYKEILECAVEEYQDLSRMIEEMLFLARADNAEAVLQKEMIDLRVEAECVTEFYQALVEEHGLSVEITGQAAIIADKGLLRRALGNLIANAIQNTPAGGKIRVELKQAGEKVVTISICNPGPGIAPEHLPRLFDRFYSIDKARTPGKNGTGLGLAIVRSIMQLHGGDIEVTSTLGEKTQFVLVFPAGT